MSRGVKDECYSQDLQLYAINVKAATYVLTCLAEHQI